MKVFIAERGLYEDRYVAGLFSSVEKAMAAMPGEKWEEEDGFWMNELDWDDSVRIFEMEIDVK